MNWQPIETAPNGGESVLLGNADEVAEGLWTGRKWVLVSGDHWNVRTFYNQPTHWMPMPEPPTEEEIHAALINNISTEGFEADQ